jgi:hypothetical protein
VKEKFVKKPPLKFYLVIAALVLAMLACEFSASTANIANAQMARDSEGNALTSVFSPQENFYCVLELANAPDDTSIKAIWTAVDVAGSEPDTLIDESEITTGSGSVYFELSNSSPWPPGQYKVDIYLNGELDRTLEFQVQTN